MIDGRYRAEKRLGAGGMAEVWCAEDEVLGRRVALKLMGGRFAEDPEFRERFRREAQAAAGMQHPNIVGVYDRSEWDGTPYIAMELVDGKTLKELVTERGPLPPDVAVGLTEQVLRALGYAHRRGIVHRDVKPQNVIIDRDGQAKVADFGIARAGDTSEMTQAGAIVGTMQYLSPEQAEGHPVDRRADLYSVGIVLYELLTGRVPFDGEAPISIAIKQINERPVPPGQLQPGIPPALEAVVLRALEKDPARRYQSAEEFIAALEAARRAPTRQIVMEPTPGEPWDELEDEERRTRWWVWALVAAGAGRDRRGGVLHARRQQGRRAEPRRARGERGGRRRAPARAGDRVRPARVRRRPARRGDLAGPAGGRRAPRRARPSRRSSPPGAARCPSRGRREVRGRRGAGAARRRLQDQDRGRRSRTRCRRAR